jgi:diguanylate cyclase (GGDEF)-like protein
MLRIVMVFAWILAGATLASALLGLGSLLSNALASLWFAVLSVFLVVWPKMNIFWHRCVALTMLVLVILRWSLSWFITPPAEAMMGILLGLLYIPILVMVATLLWAHYSLVIGVTTCLVMGVVAMIGSRRDALSDVYLNDWRLGLMVAGTYGLFAWLLSIWAGERADLRRTAERAERLHEAANTDTLTGIANRRVAERRLQVLAAGHHRYAIMMIDIDRFKLINDHHGHDMGDRILQRVAEILTARMRSQDTVARWGGEEFLVIAESVTRDESAIIAESLRSLVERGTQEVLSTTISIGVVHSNVGRGTEQMLKRADEALYAAKNSGRNRAITL